MPLSLPFRRKPSDPATESSRDQTGAEDGASQTTTATRARAYTPSKRELGKATPKRTSGVRRVETAPKDRKEAAKRQAEKRKELREKQRVHRAEVREGMLAGKEEYLPVRDKGPERSTVRDIVDSRRNLASYFLPGALIVIIGSSGAMPPAVQLGTTIFWVMLSVGIVVDSFLLTRRVRKVLSKKFPKAIKPPRAHYSYAIFRSLQIRRLRMPHPKVKVGDRVEA